MSDDLLVDLWTEPEEEAMIADLDTLRRDSNTFQQTIRKRNYVEVFAAGLVVAIFARSAWLETDLLLRLSTASMALGGVFVAWKFITQGDSPSAEPARTTAAFVAARRAELEYQARFLDGIFGWYIAPFVPGFLGVSLAVYLAAGFTAALPTMGVIVVISGSIWMANLDAAKKLRTEAAELPVFPEGEGS